MIGYNGKNVVDTLYAYLDESLNSLSDFHREHYSELFNNIMYGGKKVDLNTFFYVRSLVLIAKEKLPTGDIANTRLFLYYAAKNMGLCD